MLIKLTSTDCRKPYATLCPLKLELLYLPDQATHKSNEWISDQRMNVNYHLNI